MAASVTYTTINGMLMMESRGGVDTAYVTDTQGSLIQCRNSVGTKTYEAWYWPYGEVRSETGTNPSKWGYIGLLGYMKDAANLLYVRKRVFKPNLTQWLTVDPFWPQESAYGYCKSSPNLRVDPSGTLNLVVIAGAVGVVVAVAGPCAAAGYYLYLRYARDMFPFPNDDLGHCVASCMLTAYMPWCSLVLPFASECVGDFDWRDVLANTIGVGCGSIRITPWPLPPWPPSQEQHCINCCRLGLRQIWPPPTR